MPNIAFILKRGEAVPRNSGATLYGDVDAMDDLTVQPSSGAAVTLADSGNTIDGVTGADGTASFTVRQDNTPGYKTPLTVTLTDNATITATLDTIFRADQPECRYGVFLGPYGGYRHGKRQDAASPAIKIGVAVRRYRSSHA